MTLDTFEISFFLNSTNKGRHKVRVAISSELGQGLASPLVRCFTLFNDGEK